ncbi:MAG TPA: hypothetical protein VIF83_09260 [Gemmatimonadaceae bacterium]|jgi:hypothetical protein
MDQSAPRSLKHEYELYVEQEIENYKDSISRTNLLKIGDEAVASLRDQAQFAMDELLLWDEVDKIIRKRLRLPSYSTWRKRYLRRLVELEELRRPERWGFRSDSVMAREIHPPAESRVLVAGADSGNAALYLAAQGCAVTAVNTHIELVENVLNAAEAAHLPGKIDGHPRHLREWLPSEAELLSAVICTATAFAGLTSAERAKVIDVLQSATSDGGVHLVETIIAGQSAVSVTELRRNYKGWKVSVVQNGNSAKSFVARKVA